MALCCLRIFSFLFSWSKDMPITLGDTTITGLGVGGLPSGTVNATTLANGAVTRAKMGYAGAVLQVISTTKTDTFSETVARGAQTGTITGLTATITPTSASNKVLVMLQISFMSSQSTHNINTFLYRGATQIALADANGSQFRATASQGQGGNSGENITNCFVTFLDSPATTSATTYSIKLSTGLANSNTIYVNRSPTDTNVDYIARATSTITLMEIAG